MRYATLFLAGLIVWSSIPANAASHRKNPPADFKHIVIIYEENHSFDNLYGLWGAVDGEKVNGLANASAATATQVRQDGMPYKCLLQLDVNLTSPPLPASCTDNGTPAIASAFPNAPFKIDDYINSTDTTCPSPEDDAPNGVLKGQGLPGGCTRDIIHRYYTEQYQIDNGKQDRYVTGSDAAGLTMGHYDTAKLPIYAFLHSAKPPHYVIADNFYQGAFGGSFFNHQWLVAAAAPVFANAINDGSKQDLHAIVDANGMANNAPLYASPLGKGVKLGPLTASCNPPAGTPPNGITCGDYAVNTIQPFAQPYMPGTPDYKRLPPVSNPTIGDRLSQRGVRWAWYSGGWSNADGDVDRPGWTNGATAAQGCTDKQAMPKAVWPNCPDALFQFHHQPFNYFAAYGPGTAARAEHLRDEQEFIERAGAGTLLSVSFIKPIGEENEHPGYASQSNGDSHLVDLLKTILNGPDGKNTLVIVTYDEFGGQWDHASPPGNPGNPGPHDKWGPGTRIPAMLISARFAHSGVDHVEHDTTSIMATLEHLYGLAPVGERDANVPDLLSAVNIGLRKAR